MKKRILVRGPLLSRSGYGEQARFALRSLRAHEDRFDIYVHPVGWGQSSWIHEDTEERRWIDELVTKTAEYQQAGGQYDISLQVTIPNEWEQMAPINIGYTAGIETTAVAPVWIEKSKVMNQIIVVSNHAKTTFEETVYQAQDNKTGKMIDNFRCTTPIEVVNYPVRSPKPEKIDLELSTDFNFLTVMQWGPRKNLENAIRWFVEEFIDVEVGLIVKTSIACDAIIDKIHVEKRLSNLLKEYPQRKCKIYLVHGDMSDGEMTSLYTDKRVKALVSLSHGEGYGLPMFEAAYNGLPVITTGWSGQCDFLFAPAKERKKGNDKKTTTVIKPHFAKVEFTLQPILPEAVWDGVLMKESMWAYPEQGSYKMRLRDVYKNHEQHLSTAALLKKHILKNFKEEDMYAKFSDAVYKEEEQEIEDWLSNLDPQVHA
tara:strand:+ start:6365 stop:7648 length:1284 start_codon:yes stop_codon:yes gene_type:complete